MPSWRLLTSSSCNGTLLLYYISISARMCDSTRYSPTLHPQGTGLTSPPHTSLRHRPQLSLSLSRVPKDLFTPCRKSPRCGDKTIITPPLPPPTSLGPPPLCCASRASRSGTGSARGTFPLGVASASATSPRRAARFAPGARVGMRGGEAPVAAGCHAGTCGAGQPARPRPGVVVARAYKRCQGAGGGGKKKEARDLRAR